MGVAIGADSDRFVIVNSAGYGFIAKFSDMTSNKKTGKAFMRVPNQGQILPCEKILEGHDYIAAITNLGKLLIFTLDQLPELAKGKGNKIIHIPKKQFQEHDERLSHFKTFPNHADLIITRLNGDSMTIKNKDIDKFIANRAKRGRSLPRGYQQVSSIDFEIKASTSSDKDAAK